MREGAAAARADHERELDLLRARVRERGARLLAVVFPDLADVAGSAPYAARALAYFRDRGAPVIDLPAAYRDRTPEELCVSPRDTHPSEWVHADVAERMQAELERLGWIR